MANKVLSVVVPTYNMEAYLPHCLDSVTREDMPNTLEVIVVNDGSKDRSLEIAKQYQEKRPDIIQIIDKPNGHYGSCINEALKVATGKYFRPLDADDWFDTDALITLLNKLSSISVDLILTKSNQVSKTGTKTIGTSLIPEKRYSKKSISLLVKQKSSSCTMHTMTYKTSILKNSNLKLSEGICYTDIEYVVQPFPFVTSFLFFDLCLYQYTWGREGQSMERKAFISNRFHKYQICKSFLNCKRYSKNSFTYKKIYEELVSYFYTILFLRPANNDDDESLKEIDFLAKEFSTIIAIKVYCRLLLTPILWKFTGIHFLFYEKIKKIYHDS